MKGISRRARACAVVAVTGVAVLATSNAAQAQRPAKVGDGIPTGQGSVQMFNYGSFIQHGLRPSFGTTDLTISSVSAACVAPEGQQTGQGAPPNPANTTACHKERLEALFKLLQKKGVTNIELFSHASFPANTDTAGLAEYRALLEKYGLHAAGWHGSMNEAQFDVRLAAAKALGADSLGSGGVADPGITTYQAVLNSAAALNRMGEKAVKAGVGPVYIHNHTDEFDRKYVDNGELKTAWQILMERTDPRYVFAEVDVFWSSDAFNDETGTKTADLINGWSSRIKMLHIKDGINVTTQPSPTNSRGGSPRATGTGVVDFRPIFAAAKNTVQYYHQEHDGGTIADAEVSLTNLKGINTASVPSVLGYPAGSAPVAANGTTAGNTFPVRVENSGDKPLTITATSITGDDSGDFQVISNACNGQTLAPGTLATETAPAVARGKCTVLVGYRGLKTNTQSVAYLSFTSNANDATEKVLLTGSTTAQLVGGAGGTVAPVLALNLSGAASFGAFTPGVAKNYDTNVTASLLSTAGDATLSVSDPSAVAPGHLVNGAFSLPSALQISANNAANPAVTYKSLSEVSGAQTTLLTYAGPTAGQDNVTLNFRQAVGANDALRSGSYAKTLTFTVSTTTP
jgi:sugar phosphate isomerase/epimerase